LKKEKKIMNLSPRKKLFVDTATEMFGDGAILTKSMTKEAAAKAKIHIQHGFVNHVQ
jgi:hypothetical protein